MKVNELFSVQEAKPVDMLGKKHKDCGGTFQETSQYDDMDGKLHCTKCNKEILRHLTEGRWIKGPGGVPLGKDGKPIPPKEPKPKAVKEPKEPAIDLQAVYNKVITIVGNTFPDGDPMDSITPYMRKLGVKDWDISKTVDAALKKCGDRAEKKGLHSYLASMWDQSADDAMYDAETEIKKGKKPSDSPFLTNKNGKVEKRSNPWK